tara:strand:+ start:54630 stop:54998 length:369 start_codon:yes stop_codon:yes gene_type:complete
MPSFNFKPQFCAAIRSGQKRQTIRTRGKRPAPKPGQIAYLFTGLRTTSVCRLGEHPITSVTPISIGSANRTVSIAGEHSWQQLDASELEQLARADGFNSAADFFAFFNDEFGPTFSGYLIKW